MSINLPETRTDFFLDLDLQNLVKDGLWVEKQERKANGRIYATYKVPKTQDLLQKIDLARLISPSVSPSVAEELSHYLGEFVQQRSDGKLFYESGEPVYVHPNFFARLKGFPPTKPGPQYLTEPRSAEADMIADRWGISKEADGYLESAQDFGISCSDWFEYAVHRSVVKQSYPTLIEGKLVYTGS